MQAIGNKRGKLAERRLGLDFEAEDKRVGAVLKQEEERERAKQEKKQRLLHDNPVYALMDAIATYMDKYCLDPILGFFFPGVGDVITGACVLPYLYFSLAEVHSIPLALAVLKNAMVDVLVGAVPWVGDFLDLFHKSNKKNFALVKGYIDDDAETIKKVNEGALIALIVIVVVGYVAYKLISWTVGIASSIWDFISSLF